MYTAFLLGFDIYYEVRHNGQTPGKKAANIRVVREGGAPVDFTAACIRNLLGLADFLPVFYLLGSLLILLTLRGQRLGDMAAGTLVIRERAVAPPVLNHLDEARAMAAPEIQFTSVELAACTPNDLHVLKAYFQRRRDMETLPRFQLAQRLADEYLRKTSYQPAAPIDHGHRAEAFLASLYRDLVIDTQARQGGRSNA